MPLPTVGVLYSAFDAYIVGENAFKAWSDVEVTDIKRSYV